MIMTRRMVIFGGLALTLPLLGCGGDAPPPADKSNMPADVRAEEEALEANAAKREAEIQKRMTKKGR